MQRTEKEYVKPCSKCQKVETCILGGFTPPKIWWFLSHGQKLYHIRDLLWLARVVLASAQTLGNCWNDTRQCFPMFLEQRCPINWSFQSFIIQTVCSGSGWARHKAQDKKQKVISDKWYVIGIRYVVGILPNLVDSRRKSWSSHQHSGGVENLDYRYPLNLFLN